jgi:hypothetical protein
MRMVTELIRSKAIPATEAVLGLPNALVLRVFLEAL